MLPNPKPLQTLRPVNPTSPTERLTEQLYFENRIDDIRKARARGMRVWWRRILHETSLEFYIDIFAAVLGSLSFGMFAYSTYVPKADFDYHTSIVITELIISGCCLTVYLIRTMAYGYFYVLTPRGLFNLFFCSPLVIYLARTSPSGNRGLFFIDRISSCSRVYMINL